MEDLTGLPYIHGFWVGREGELAEPESRALLRAQEQGSALKGKIAEDYARKNGLSIQAARIMPMHFLILSERKKRLHSKNLFAMHIITAS